MVCKYIAAYHVLLLLAWSVHVCGSPKAVDLHVACYFCQAGVKTREGDLIASTYKQTEENTGAALGFTARGTR